ncbi:MAG: cell division protein FtsA [Acidobacteria bacterium]|nr:cell division protein FtsA [Acidobacteriota bacterium]
MNGPSALTGIDVGSRAVCVVVAAIEDDRLVVKGCGHAAHDGAKKGVISDLDQVVSAVRAAADEAEAMASLPVEDAVVGLGGTPIQGVRATASVPVTGRRHTVTEDDERRALRACGRITIPPDYRVLDIIPCAFAVDGQGGMERAVGMPGNRLDASGFVLYSHKTHADTVEQAVNRAGVRVTRLVFEPLAAAEAVLTADEKDLGCLLIDIGYGSTEWILYADRAVVATGSTPVAGRVFTNDLAVVLKTTTAAAEDVKRRVGILEAARNPDTGLEVPAQGGEGMLVYAKSLVGDVLRERARDLFVRIHQVLAANDLARVARAGVVLTGGAAQLDGLVEQAQEIFGSRARVGTPQGFVGLTEPVSSADWSVACGLALKEYHRIVNREVSPADARESFFAKIKGVFGEIFELGGGS